MTKTRTSGAEQAATRRIEMRPLSDLRPDPRNPKAHDVDLIDASVGRFGFVEPIVIDGRTGHIISGHGRAKTLQAMHARGEAPPDGVTLSDEGDWLVPVATGWSSRTDSEASAALIALNRTTELGGWVDDSLLDLLDGLIEEDIDGTALAGVGYDEEAIEALRASLDAAAIPSDGIDFDSDPEEDEPGGDSTGRADPATVGADFALMDVTVGEPRTRVRHGDTYRLSIGERTHYVTVRRLGDEYPLWSPLLNRVGFFAPYPEPYFPLSVRAAEVDTLMVQPNVYLAGHLIDYVIDVHGHDAVEDVTGSIDSLDSIDTDTNDDQDDDQ